jgi:hypothetical protein
LKFATEDKKYLEARKRLSDTYGKRELWSVADHWPLYCGTANLGRFMAISDLLREALEIPGHVAEFGSWRGANLLFLAKLLRIYDSQGSKQVHCFDSFEGLTTFASEDGAAADEKGEYSGSMNELTDMIDLYELQDDITIHKGLIQDTLPRFIDENPGVMMSFIYCDTDLFEPTKLILENMHDRLVAGGLFVLDQWSHERWPGESLAVQEFLSDPKHQYKMRPVRNARQPTLILEKQQT